MNAYRTFTKKLIENYPLLWHSKFLQMIVIGILLNVFSFLAGYIMTDLSELKNLYINNYFNSSGYAFFYGAILLIIIPLWALTYFKNNSIKNFYPVDNLYLIKLFFIFFFISFVFSASFYAFKLGVCTKIKSNTDIIQVTEEINKINQAAPFLGLDFEYDYKTRVYPDFYNQIKYIEVEDTDSSYVNENEEYYKQEYFYIKYGNEWKLISTYDLKKNGALPVNIADDTIVACITHDMNDTCDSKTMIDSFLTKANLSDLDDQMVINYNGNLIDLNTDDDYNPEKKINSYNSRIRIKDYNKELAPITYDWVINKQTDSIVIYLNHVKNIATKYKVDFNYSSDNIVKKWVKFNFKAYENEIPFINDSEIKIENSQLKNTFIDLDDLKNVFSNIQEANYNSILFDTFLFSLFTAAIIALIIVFFEFANLKLFLISIPIAGIFSIAIVFIITIFLDFDNTDLKEIVSLSIAIGFMLLVYIILFISLYSHIIQKRFTIILFYLAYFSIPFFIYFICQLAKKLTEYSVTKCNVNTIEYSINLNLPSIFGITIAFYIIFLLFVKRLLAKEE